MVESRKLHKSPMVYCATNIVNDKCYIGVTRYKLSVRRSAHYSRAKTGGQSVINRAIRKYGRDSFAWSILCECETYEEALNQEVFCIKRLNPEYNMTSGGESALVKFLDRSTGARKYSEDILERMGRRKAVSCSDGKSYKSITEAAEAYGMYRGPLRRLIARGGIARAGAATGLGFWYTNEGKLEKPRRYRSTMIPIICDNGRIYESVTDAARELGLDVSSVTKCCRGKLYRTGGYAFRYVDM